MFKEFHFINNKTLGEAGIAFDGNLFTGQVTDCKLNKSGTKLTIEISGDCQIYEYSLIANPQWGSFFQRFCQEFELIDKNCRLEPSKLVGRYVNFTVYTRSDGSDGVRWIEATEDQIVDYLTGEDDDDDLVAYHWCDNNTPVDDSWNGGDKDKVA